MGDPVRILERPWEPNDLRPGATGIVVEVQVDGSVALLCVQGFNAADGVRWHHRFRLNQVQAYITGASKTIHLSLSSSDA